MLRQPALSPLAHLLAQSRRGYSLYRHQHSVPDQLAQASKPAATSEHTVEALVAMRALAHAAARTVRTMRTRAVTVHTHTLRLPVLLHMAALTPRTLLPVRWLAATQVWPMLAQATIPRYARLHVRCAL